MLITGGDTGIGRAVALAFASRAKERTFSYPIWTSMRTPQKRAAWLWPRDAHVC